MKSFIAISALAAMAASTASAATVNSPASLIECQPAAIQWSEATGDVYLSVVQGKDISSTPLETFPTQSGASGSYTWTVNQPAGTQLTFIVNDSTGKPNYSSQVSVNAGSTSCLGASASSSASSGASSASSSASSAAASSSGSKSTSTGSGNKSSTTASSGSPSSTASGSSGASSFATVNGAAAAIVGAVAAGFAMFA